jgi:hypothetical protein
MGIYTPFGGNNSGSVLTAGAGFAINRKAVNDAAYSVLASDCIVAYTALSATRAVTLPTASTVTNQIFIIKDETGNAGTDNITLVGTIDGATNKSISTGYGAIRLYSNGTAYFSW